VGKETARLEAFSDGVFAIAITLLVLELKVPSGDLWQGLLREWPSFLSFTLSFLTILIMWTNHHANLAHVVQADGRLLFSNGFLLFWVTFLPFPTAVLGQHLMDGDARMAAMLYSGTFVAINLSWIAFWRSIVRDRARLAPTLPEQEVRGVNQALGIGILAYACATVLSWLSAPLGVGLCMALAGFWTVQAMRHHRDDHHHDAGSSA